MSDDGAAGGPHIPPEAQAPMDERDERERRLAALRGLAQQESAPAEPAPPAAASSAPSATRASRAPAVRHGRARHPFWRQPRMWALATAVLATTALAVVIIGAVVLQAFGGALGRSQAKRAPTPGVAIPALDQLHCESSVAWAPDGRYLIDAAQLSVLLTPQGMAAPSGQTLEKLQLDNAVGLPVRDAAMLAVMKAIAHPKANRALASGAIAWSPDGKLLAVMAGESMPQQDEDYAIVTIKILSCATGKTLATLKAHAAVNQTGIGGNEYMAWSPDGKHLFYFTDQFGSLTTWGPGLLPQG